MKILHKITGACLFENNKDNLSRADLYGADLCGANLSRADLYGADLYGADLCGANLSRADLYGANLSGANLSRADLSRADLYGANLSGANLSGANLYGANLSGANLSGANLSRANLRGAKNILVLGPMNTSGRLVYAIKHNNCIMIQAGCFWGTLEELQAKAKKENKPMYLAACDFIIDWALL